MLERNGNHQQSSTPWHNPLRALAGIECQHSPRLSATVTLKDGATGWVDLSQWLRSRRVDGSVFEALREEDFFKLARVELGSVTWPNGADLSSVAMYDALLPQRLARLPRRLLLTPAWLPDKLRALFKDKDG